MEFIQAIVIGVSALIAIWFMLPYFTKRVHNIGNISGLIICICSILIGVFLPNISSTNWIYGIIIVAATGIFLLFAVIFVMVRAIMTKPVGPQTLVVLGCRVYGKKASLMLIERLDAAYAYLSKNQNVVCIVSGGQGEGEEISEAQCMKTYLVEKGINSERIIMEDRSTSTRENLIYSKEIIETLGLPKTIAITTNEFHEYRSFQIAKKLELIPSAIPGKTAWWLFATFFLRECYGIIYEWIKDYDRT